MTNQTVHIRALTPEALWIAYDLARINVQVHLWADSQLFSQTDSFPLTAVADTHGTLRELYAICGTLGQAYKVDIQQYSPGKTWFYVPASAEFVRLPEPHIGGVTAAVLAPQMRNLLTRKQRLRAFLDRFLPVLTLGKTELFADVVRGRMGEAAAQLALAYQATRTHLTGAQLRSARAVPGLNQAITRAGSLSGAVQLLAEAHRERRLYYPVGGAQQARLALLATLQSYGVIVHTGETPPANIEFLDPAVLAAPSQRGAHSVAAVNSKAAALAANLPAAPELTHRETLQGVSVLATAPDAWQAEPGDEAIVLPTGGDGGLRLRLLHTDEAQALWHCGNYECVGELSPRLLLAEQLTSQPQQAAAQLLQTLENLGAQPVSSCSPTLPDAQHLRDSVSEALAGLGAPLHQLRKELLGL